VVGSHHFNESFIERIPQRLAICGVADRRRTFILRRAVGNLRSVKPEIVCTGFYSDGHATLARIPQQRQRLARAKERAAQVDGKDKIEVLDRHVRQQRRAQHAATCGD